MFPSRVSICSIEGLAIEGVTVARKARKAATKKGALAAAETKAEVRRGAWCTSVLLHPIVQGL